MQTTTNNTVNQIEPVVVGKTSLLSVIKQRVKKFFRPQWKKWKAGNDISRFVEAVYMQEIKQGLSHDNRKQLHALEREIGQTRELARYCFISKPGIRTKQLCGHHLNREDQKTAFNCAVLQHLSALKREVIATDIDQSLPRMYAEAIDRALKNIPVIDSRTQYSEASIVQVVPDTTPETTIEVAAEVLLTEAVVSNTTALTDVALLELRKAMAGKTSIRQLKLPQLKRYAKAHGIRIPGKATRIKEIKNIVAAAQGSNKLLKI